MAEFVVNSDVSLQQAIGGLRDEYRQHRYVRVQTKAGTKRSRDQNAIAHAWYAQIERELREGARIGAYGELQVREYDKRDGGKGTSVDVLVSQIDLLDKRHESGDQQRSPAQRREPAPAKAPSFDDVPFDDDIPF